MRFLLAVTAAVFVAAAYALGPTVPMATKDAAAKQFKPAPGRASLYVARKRESLGSAVPFRIYVDGKELASLLPGSFALVSLEPGKHELRAVRSSGASRTPSPRYERALVRPLPDRGY